MRRNLTRWLIIILVIFLVISAFGAGVYFGYFNRPPITKLTNVLNRETPDDLKIDFSPFWKVWHTIDEKYVNGNGTTTKIANSEARVWGAAAGLVEALGDPYSVFLPPEEKKTFEEEISGNFGGVGIEIGMEDKTLTVIAALPDTPAEQAGIKSGDKIIIIDNEPSTAMSVDDAVKKIRGPIDTFIKLGVSRDGENKPLEFTIKRALIKVPTLETKKFNWRGNQAFVIKLYNFNAEAANDFRRALREFILADTNKLILDLRGNPGGYLSAAVDMASWFLPAGKPVVIEDHGGKSEPEIYRSHGYNVFNKNLKMAVLIDRGSASASEILAGALSEHNKAVLVGEKTFGKGSVQELIKITPESSLKITIAKWLTPNGHSISGNGLKPTVEVSLNDEEKKNPPKRGSEELDSQLKKAIEVLSEKNTQP